MNNEDPNNIIKVKPAFGLFLLALLIVCYSCAAKRSSLNTEDIIEANPKLIFLNYNIKKTNSNNKLVQFINQIITDGKLKGNSNKYTKEGVSGDLKCNQIDKNGMILNSIVVKNPLTKNIEYVDDSKNFKLKQVVLDSSQFSLRMQLHPNAKYISIIEIKELNKNPNPLIKTKLN